MATKVKFCGLKTTEAVRLAAELGAWKIGFIFFPKSPRHVGLAEATELGRLARDIGLETTAVTVNASEDELAEIVSLAAASAGTVIHSISSASCTSRMSASNRRYCLDNSASRNGR